MTRLGFTSPKPIKFVSQKDPKKIDGLFKETYLLIKLRITKEGVRIYRGNKAGIQSADNFGRTCGIKEKRLVIRRNGSRSRSNMLAAISP